MSTEENSNTIEAISLLNIIVNPNETNNITTPEVLKSQTNLITNEQKIKQLKQKLKSLLQKNLAKSLLILEKNNQNQLQILTATTKSYNEFNDRINFMKNQVEENIRKKEENKKIKKIKVAKAKFRSRTSQKLNNNVYKKDSIKTLNNESNKSLTKIRPKTEGKNNKIQYSEKKAVKHIKLDSKNNKELNSTLKLNTHKKSFSKFNLTEYNTNNNSNKASKKNIKERKESKDIQPIVKKNNSRTKINVIHKNQYDLKSSSNLLTDSNNKTDKDKISNNNDKKILTSKKNNNFDYRKSFDYSNRKIPKPKINNYVKKNTEIFTEKKISQKKNYVNKKISTKKEEKINREEDTDIIIKRFEKQKELLEKIRKQREENTLRNEERKREFEKEQEEERKREEEERAKRDMEIKRKEEQRKKELEEEQRKIDEERRKKQLEIEAKIEREKIEKENFKKELERQKELEKQKKLEEEIKKEEIEKLKMEMDKINEQEEVKELPKNMELNIYKNEDNINENKNKEMNIQDLLELEEKNEQNFEYFHIKEEIEKDPLLITPDKKREQDIEIKNEDIIKNNNNENIIKEPPKISYRKISILELIHDASKFSPILFEFLSFQETLEFTAISKKIKRQRINLFNLQKIKILKNIGFEDEQSLDKKIKEYEDNYSNNELNEPYIEYHLSKGAAKAILLLNKNRYSKIFRRPVLDNNLSPIYIAYRILFIFFNEIDIANISDNKLFWIKCTEYLNTKSEEGKIGDFILNKFENYNCDCKTVYYIEKIMEGKKDNMSPSYFSKICGSTGLLIFLIKELMEYCGVIISTKKTQLSRIYKNLIFFKKIINMLSEFNKTLENFNY